ncbi:AAA family ATPase [Ectopseudomonas hydrolytica]|uniref:AAA family ATPase n=1 Tax=Ectopseudomonas hydrolytica TaxID=2493633 RepID=UPI00376F2D61
MSVSKIIPLTNVGLLAGAIERAMQRPIGLPGLVVMYGPSGLGKSVAAACSANQHRAYYVECRDTWTKKAFLLAVLREMAVTPARTLSEMVDQVAEQLSRSGRPLIVDDVQYLLEKAAANVLTDIYNASQGTIVLIGEENVATSLAKLERLHNRVLEWVPAQAATLADVKRLAANSYPHLQIAEELLADLVKNVKGCLRRAAVNLYRVSSECTAKGLREVDLATWTAGWFTGEPPRRGAK